MSNEDIREHLVRLLDWHDAHVSFDQVVDEIPARVRGMQPPNAPHSAWQLVEHMRITQHDILDFCINPKYEEMKWPDEYWPSSAAPPSASAWDGSIASFRKDRKALQQLAKDPKITLTDKIPHGSGQTYLREIVLVADHTSYHVGQLVLVLRLLEAWDR